VCRLALWLIKKFVPLRADGRADGILIPRLTQSRFVGGNPGAASGIPNKTKPK